MTLFPELKWTKLEADDPLIFLCRGLKLVASNMSYITDTEMFKI